MKLSLHEKFDLIGKEKSINKKKKMLKDIDSPGVRAVLRSTYDNSIQWIVPDTVPPYEVNDAPEFDLSGMSLEMEASKLGRFVLVDGQMPTAGQGLKQVRRENLFIQLLEGLHQSESELLLDMVRGRLPYKGLTASLVSESFPGLLKGVDSEGPDG